MKKLSLIVILVLSLLLPATLLAGETKIGLWGCKVDLVDIRDEGTHWEVDIAVTNGNGVTYNKVRAELSRYENDTEKLLEQSNDFTENFKDGNTVLFKFVVTTWVKKGTSEIEIGWHSHFRLYEID